MNRIFALILVLSFASTAVWSQQISADQASTGREDILKLFDVMHLRDQMKLVMNQVSAQMKATSHEQLRRRDPQITDEEIARLDAQSDELLKGMPIDGMLEDMIPVYQKHLSKSDVNAMVGFYSSPTGRKILQEMPSMTAEGKAVQPRLRNRFEFDC
jgi:uncharacterized protein